MYFEKKDYEQLWNSNETLRKQTWTNGKLTSIFEVQQLHTEIIACYSKRMRSLS
jgi:hypothetical protein